LKNFKIKEFIPLLLIVILVVYCFAGIFITPVWGDEKEFHYPEVKNISISQIVDKNSSYSTTYPPLPYIMGAAVYKIFKDIYSLRILNYFIFLFLVYFFYKIAVNLSGNPLTFLLLLISNPYILKGSFIYYMTDYGLLFGVAGIYFYFFSHNKYKFLTAHFLFGLAVLCQQWMLIIIFSVFLNECADLYLGKLQRNFFLKGLLYKFLFLLPSLLLFYFWGGLTHPNFQYHKLTPSFVHLTGSLANIGLFGIFLLFFIYKKYFKIEHILLVYFLPLLFLTIPVHSEKQGSDFITGAASQISIQLQDFIYLPYKLSMLILAVAGLLTMVAVISKEDGHFIPFLKYVLAGFLVAFFSSERLGATHIFISIPFLFLVFNSDLKENKLLQNLLIIFFYSISLFYLFYFTLFKTKGLYL
jgi:hypothetical protein